MQSDEMFTTPEDIAQTMKQQKKSMSRASIPALLALLAVTPVWLFFLLPTAIVSQLFLFLKRKTKEPKTSPAVPTQPVVEEQKTPQQERKYDVVVYGATGFTGKLAVRYLATQYGDKVKWAIAGRNKAALEAVNNQVPILIADATDRESLAAMARSTKAVIALAGPFAKLGSLLVRVCAETGTHYVDITGEVPWVKEMIEQNDEIAQKTGARIVHFCGHDCVPWDLTVRELAMGLKEAGDEMEEVQCFNEIIFAPSGGTLATMFHALATPEQKRPGGFSALIRLPDGSKAPTKFISANPGTLRYSNVHKSWVGFAIMAQVMARCVSRSQALLNYCSTLKYSEATVYSDFVTGFVESLGLIIGGTALMIPPLAQLLLKLKVLPNPGDGPSAQVMDKGFLRLVAYARGTKGGTATATLYLPTDPGYRDTARMAVESGLTLALEGKKLQCGGGVFTPAACLGRVLLARLIATGAQFAIRVAPASKSQ